MLQRHISGHSVPDHDIDILPPVGVLVRPPHSQPVLGRILWLSFALRLLPFFRLWLRPSGNRIPDLAFLSLLKLFARPIPFPVASAAFPILSHFPLLPLFPFRIAVQPLAESVSPAAQSDMFCLPKVSAVSLSFAVIYQLPHSRDEPLSSR